MKSQPRLAVLFLLAAILLTPVFDTVAGEKWTSVARLTAGGGVKEVPLQCAAQRCLIRCIDGSIIVNTVVAREGGSSSPFRVGRRFALGEEQIVDFGSVRELTGLRISDDGQGVYEVLVGMTRKPEPVRGSSDCSCGRKSNGRAPVPTVLATGMVSRSSKESAQWGMSVRR